MFRPRAAATADNLRAGAKPFARHRSIALRIAMSRPATMQRIPSFARIGVHHDRLVRGASQFSNEVRDQSRYGAIDADRHSLSETRDGFCALAQSFAVGNVVPIGTGETEPGRNIRPRIQSLADGQ